MQKHEQTFTIEQGLEYQKICLINWEFLLKPEIYARLKAWIERCNAFNHYITGYDVVRGDDITNYVLNHIK